MSLCDYLSVCVFSLRKKLTRQEDQKLFFNFAWPNAKFLVNSQCQKSYNTVAVQFDREEEVNAVSHAQPTKSSK